MSPECSQPSMIVSAVLSGNLKYPLNTLPPRHSTSPSSAMRTSHPGIAWPTEPGWLALGLHVIGPLDSLIP